MGRTAGATSNISIPSHTLITLLGGVVTENTPKTFVTIGRKWLEAFQEPAETMLSITASDYEALKNGNPNAILSMESGQPLAAPAPARLCHANIED